VCYEQGEDLVRAAGEPDGLREPAIVATRLAVLVLGRSGRRFPGVETRRQRCG
jgi:hypothetical protein